MNEPAEKKLTFDEWIELHPMELTCDQWDAFFAQLQNGPDMELTYAQWEDLRRLASESVTPDQVRVRH